MRLKIESLKELMKVRYKGNYHAFARALGFDVSALYKILNKQANAGLKTINKIFVFLKQQDLKIDDYIFLE